MRKFRNHFVNPKERGRTTYIQKDRLSDSVKKAASAAFLMATSTGLWPTKVGQNPKRPSPYYPADVRRVLWYPVLMGTTLHLKASLYYAGYTDEETEALVGHLPLLPLGEVTKLPLPPWATAVGDDPYRTVDSEFLFLEEARKEAEIFQDRLKAVLEK